MRDPAEAELSRLVTLQEYPRKFVCSGGFSITHQCTSAPFMLESYDPTQKPFERSRTKWFSLFRPSVEGIFYPRLTSFAGGIDFLYSLEI
jgi:hypothetical protein